MPGNVDEMTLATVTYPPGLRVTVKNYTFHNPNHSDYILSEISLRLTRDIEEIMIQHPDVADVAGFGAPDDKWGERPLMIIVLKPGYEGRVTSEELKRFMEGFASDGKIPKYICPSQDNQLSSAHNPYSDPTNSPDIPHFLFRISVGKEVEDSVTGVLLKIEEDVGENKSKLYTLEVNEKPVNVWGSTILDQRMVGIKVGDLIKIVYKGLGEKKQGRNAPKIFQVLVDRPEKQPEQTVQA